MIVPLGARLLVLPVIRDNVKKLDSGLLVDMTASIEAPQSVMAKVIAAGPDCKILKPDDIVLVAAFAPTEAKEDPFDKTLIVPEEDILAVIVPDNTAKA